MIGAVILDLDGLLIDSEPCWQQAQREVFTSLGVPLTDAEAQAMTGRRVADHVDHWYARYPWTSLTKAEVVATIEERALALIRAFGLPLPGAVEVVRELAARRVPLGVASSSPSTIIYAALELLGIRDSVDVIQSAELEPSGKPHPGVYLSAARALGVTPLFCIAFEDSVNGVRAAKAAGMACIAVPAAKDREDTRFRIADATINSLTELDVDALVNIPMRPAMRPDRFPPRAPDGHAVEAGAYAARAAFSAQ